jgi:two-component system NarL family response regulator
MSQSTVIRILIVDDHSIVRQGLAAIIEQEADMSVIDQAEDGVEAIKLFRQEQPDVTLMDLRMPQITGVEAIAAICAEFANGKIMVLGRVFKL